MQIFNPFLTIIAAGVGVSVVSMGRLVALRSLMGLSAPFLGSLADRVGYRSVIRMSLLATAAGMILAGLSRSLTPFALAMVLAGVGHIGFTPNLHAYLSSRLSYRRRATGLGIIEYSWALAGIVGLFLSGQLIEALSWRAPFIGLGSSLLIMALAYGTLPSAKPSPTDPVATERRSPLSLRSRLMELVDLGPNWRSAWAGVAVSAFNSFAMMHLVIIHGGWLVTEYGLGAASLGGVALMFGVVDLMGSFLVSVAGDRIGKRRGVIIGASGMMVGFALLPFLNHGLVLALLSIAIPRLFFEIAIVSHFPLLSEQDPAQRGKVLGLGMTAGLLGATAAGLTGPAAYLRFGVWGLGPVSLGASVVSLLLLLFLVQERPGSPG